MPKWGSLSFISCCVLLFCLLVSTIHTLDYKLAILKYVKSVVAPVTSSSVSPINLQNTKMTSLTVVIFDLKSG